MFRRKRSDKDFAEEIKAHLELEAAELKSEGLSEEEARRRARVEFGNVQEAKERFQLRGRVKWFGQSGAGFEVRAEAAGEESGLHVDGPGGVGAGDWRERGDLRICGCRITGAIAVYGSKPGDVGEREQHRVAAMATLLFGFSRLAAAEQIVALARCVRRCRLSAGRSRRSGAGGGRAGERRIFQDAGSAAISGARLQCGRGQAGRAKCSAGELRRMAASIWRAHRCSGQDGFSG